MEEKETKKENKIVPVAGPAVDTGALEPMASVTRPFVSRAPGSRMKNTRKSRGSRTPRQEYDQKIINIRRVARVATGGKRFNFSVAMILGDRNGSIGVGTGKGADTALAIEKAMNNAKKNMIELALTKTKSIIHPIYAKYSSARIMIMPAPGRGVAAGSATRSIIELAGISDVTAKIISPSKNGLNVARATILALSKLPGTKKKKKAPALPNKIK